MNQAKQRTFGAKMTMEEDINHRLLLTSRRLDTELDTHNEEAEWPLLGRLFVGRKRPTTTTTTTTTTTIKVNIETRSSGSSSSRRRGGGSGRKAGQMNDEISKHLSIVRTQPPPPKLKKQTKCRRASAHYAILSILFLLSSASSSILHRNFLVSLFSFSDKSEVKVALLHFIFASFI